MRQSSRPFIAALLGVVSVVLAFASVPAFAKGRGVLPKPRSGPMAYPEDLEQYCSRRGRVCSNALGLPAVFKLKEDQLRADCVRFYEGQNCGEIKAGLLEREQSQVISCSATDLCEGQLRQESLQCVVDGFKVVFTPKGLLSLAAGTLGGLAATGGAATVAALPAAVSGGLIATLPFMIHEASRAAESCDSNSNYKKLSVRLHNLALADGERELDLEGQDRELLRMPCTELDRFLLRRAEGLQERRQAKSFGHAETMRPRFSKLDRLAEVYSSHRCLKPDARLRVACRALTAMLTGAVTSTAGVLGARAAIGVVAVKAAKPGPAAAKGEMASAKPPAPAPPKPIEVGTLTLCSPVRFGKCFYNSDEVLKALKGSGMDVSESEVFYMTNVTIKNGSGPEWWDVHVFVLHKGQVYDASLASGKTVAPIPAREFFTKYVQLDEVSKVRVIPGDVHLEKFAELGGQAPAWFGTGMRTLSLPVHSGAAIEAMKQYPLVNSQTMIKFVLSQSPP